VLILNRPYLSKKKHFDAELLQVKSGFNTKLLYQPRTFLVNRAFTLHYNAFKVSELFISIA